MSDIKNLYKNVTVKKSIICHLKVTGLSTLFWTLNVPAVEFGFSRNNGMMMTAQACSFYSEIHVI